MSLKARLRVGVLVLAALLFVFGGVSFSGAFGPVDDVMKYLLPIWGALGVLLVILEMRRRAQHGGKHR